MSRVNRQIKKCQSSQINHTIIIHGNENENNWNYIRAFEHSSIRSRLYVTIRLVDCQ